MMETAKVITPAVMQDLKIFKNIAEKYNRQNRIEAGIALYRATRQVSPRAARRAARKAAAAQ
jgi:hypothetical protein